MQDIKLCTNKILYELFNIGIGAEIKEKNCYENNELVKKYYVEKTCEDSNGSKYKIVLLSEDKDNLTFTIDEIYLYLILIMNSKLSNDNENFITLRKIRSIRCLKSNSQSSYDRHIRALNRLLNKRVSVLPIKMKYEFNTIVNSKIIDYKNNTNRILELNYTLGKISELFVSSRQYVNLNFNPFCLSFKQNYCFQFMLYLLRIVFIDRKKLTYRNYSIQKMLKKTYRYTSDGFITDETYYEYIANSGNKQSEILNKAYENLLLVLKIMAKSKFIKQFQISDKTTFKYVKDNEVILKICFITRKE